MKTTEDKLEFSAFLLAIALWIIAADRLCPYLATRPLALTLVLTLSGGAVILLAASKWKEYGVKQAKTLQEEKDKKALDDELDNIFSATVHCQISVKQFRSAFCDPDGPHCVGEDDMTTMLKPFEAAFKLVNKHLPTVSKRLQAPDATTSQFMAILMCSGPWEQSSIENRLANLCIASQELSAIVGYFTYTRKRGVRGTLKSFETHLDTDRAIFCCTWVMSYLRDKCLASNLMYTYADEDMLNRAIDFADKTLRQQGEKPTALVVRSPHWYEHRVNMLLILRKQLKITDRYLSRVLPERSVEQLNELILELEDSRLPE